MKPMSCLAWWSLVGAFGVAVAGCGADQPIAQPPVAPPPTAAPAPEPEPEPEPAAEGGAGGGGGAGGAAAQPAAEVPDRPPSSGRPMILMSNPKEISSTFGSTPGAVLRLEVGKEPVVLKIPEWALPGGHNITWKVNDKPTKNRYPVVGKVCHLAIAVAGNLNASKVETRSGDFELRFPTLNRKTVNLAIGEIDLGDERRVTWTVIPPKSVDESFGVAYFYVHYLMPAFFHATTAEPTTPAE